VLPILASGFIVGWQHFQWRTLFVLLLNLNWKQCPFVCCYLPDLHPLPTKSKLITYFATYNRIVSLHFNDENLFSSTYWIVAWWLSWYSIIIVQSQVNSFLLVKAALEIWVFCIFWKQFARSQIPLSARLTSTLKRMWVNIPGCPTNLKESVCVQLLKKVKKYKS
jgi:hypothetical protein